MRIGIITDYDITRGGGIEETVVGLIKALEGNEIILCCPRIGDLENIEKLYYSRIKIHKIYTIPSFLQKFVRGAFFTRLFLLIPFRRMIKKERLNLIIDADGGLVDKILPKKMREIYFLWKLSLIHQPWLKDIWKQPKLWYKALWRTFDGLMIKLFLKPGNFKANYFVDLYTKITVNRIWNLRSDGFLYSPIKFNELKYFGRKEKEKFVVVGRFSPEKNYDFCLEVLKEIKKKIPNIFMTFIGACKNNAERKYLEILKSKAEDYKLVKNTEFIPNAPFEKIIERLKEANIFFHAQKGISSQIVVTEAMAAGCVPVVRREGGSWNEVLEKGKYGFGYKTKQECINLLLNLLKENLAGHRKLAIKKAEEYSEENFKKDVAKIVAKYAIKNGI